MKSKIDDEVLVSNIKQGLRIDDSLNELVNRHSGIFYNATSSCLNDGQIKDDFIDDKYSFFYDTVVKFDKNKGCKFSSYLFTRVRWECKRKLSKLNSKYTEHSFDPSDMDFLIDSKSEHLNQENPVTEIIFNEGMNQVNEILDDMEDTKASQVIRMRYFDGEGQRPTPYVKIKDEVGLSRYGSVIAHDRGLNKIKKKIKN